MQNENNWPAIWKDYGSVNGTFYAAPMSANMKSLVWYSPSYFKQHNYTVPTTWSDLMSLSAKMASDNSANGFKPWCGGINSGTASGWPATDWLEEAVLGQLRRPGLRRLDQPQGQVPGPARSKTR